MTSLTVELNKIMWQIDDLEYAVKEVIEKSDDLEFKWDTFIRFCHYMNRGYKDWTYEFNNLVFQEYFESCNFQPKSIVIIVDLISFFTLESRYSEAKLLNNNEVAEIVEEVKLQCLRDFTFKFKIE